MNTLERELRLRWFRQAARVHYGRCDRCGCYRDENDKPLLVARQPRRREFECLDCYDQRVAR